MNRQTLLIGFAVVALLVIGVAYWVERAPDVASRSEAPPITGAERAEQARNVIAEIQQARSSAAEPARSQPPASASQAPPAAATRAPAAGQAGGAGAITPAPLPEPAGGAGAVTPAPQAAQASGGSELDTAYEQARAFQRDGQLADAQLLFFFGARSGHGPSAFELAAMNDPNHHSAATSLLAEPDAFQAYRWYIAARDQGVAGATERLDALRAWAMAASDAGDIDAEQLLLQWE